jgi:hypothetical protein
MTKIGLPARCMLVALLAPFVAACGSNKPTTNTTTGAGSAASASQSPATAAYAYARCIRAHGIPGFPDPHVSVTQGRGKISQEVPASAGLSPKFPAAQKACRGILPPPGNSGGSEDQARRPYMLALAHCMRTHGIAGFPDPDRTGQLSLEMINAAGIDVHSHEFLDAGLACVGVTHGTVTAAQVRALVYGKGPQ